MIHQMKAHHLMQGDIMVPHLCVDFVGSGGWGDLGSYGIVQTVINLDLNCRARLFDLAVSLLPGLNAKEIDVLFVAVKAALEVGDSTLLSIGSFPIVITHCKMLFDYDLRRACS